MFFKKPSKKNNPVPHPPQNPHPHGPPDCDCGEDSSGMQLMSVASQRSFAKLNGQRRIFLNEEITKQTAADLAALLFYFDFINPSEPIHLYINSPGGELGALYQIYDMFNLTKCPIYTYCMGEAYSAAAVLLAAGAKGHRHAFANSKIMIHGIQALFPPPGEQNQNAGNDYFKFLEYINHTVVSVLAKCTNKSVNTVKDDCAHDFFMTPAQALKYGIIDKII